jgi:hypothetical protein
MQDWLAKKANLGYNCSRSYHFSKFKGGINPHGQRTGIDPKIESQWKETV